MKIYFYKYCLFCYTLRWKIFSLLPLKGQSKLLITEEKKRLFFAKKLHSKAKSVKKEYKMPPEKPKGIYHSRTPKTVLDWRINNDKK